MVRYHINDSFPQDPVRSENGMTSLDRYILSCRQMAYDANLLDVVDVIDEKNGDAWPFMKPLKREFRLKRPLEEKMKERLDSAGRDTVTDHTSLLSTSLEMAFTERSVSLEGNS